MIFALNPTFTLNGQISFVGRRAGIVSKTKTFFLQSKQNITFIGTFYVYISRTLMIVSVIIGIRLRLKHLYIKFTDFFIWQLTWQVHSFYNIVDIDKIKWVSKCNIACSPWIIYSFNESMVTFSLTDQHNVRFYIGVDIRYPQTRKVKSVCIYRQICFRTQYYFNMHMDNVLPVSQNGNPFIEWDKTHSDYH